MSLSVWLDRARKKLQAVFTSLFLLRFFYFAFFTSLFLLRFFYFAFIALLYCSPFLLSFLELHPFFD